MSIDDFGGLRLKDRVEPKFAKLESIYYGQPKEKRSLIKSIIRAYKWEYLTAFFFCMIAASISYISPFIVQKIINFLEGKTEHGDDLYYCWKLLGILVGSQLISYILYEHMLYY
jgi:ABC-type multidrug transport system fused ATPase/permease subunit